MWAGKHLQVRELLELTMLCALMYATKEAMSALPNINLVTMLILLGVLVYGWKALYAVYGFVLLEISLYGFGLWTAMYLYVWAIVVIAAMPFRHVRSRLFWAAVAGIFGLCFGALCSIPYFFVGGWAMALSFWVSGIPFDLIHCTSNAVLTFALLPVLYRLVTHLKGNEDRLT